MFSNRGQSARVSQRQQSQMARSGLYLDVFALGIFDFSASARLGDLTELRMCFIVLDLDV